MLKKFGIIFISAGFSFISFSILFFFLTSRPVQIGIIWNTVLFSFECLWYFFIGVYFIFIGVLAFSGKYTPVPMIQAGGYILIFSIVFFSCTFVFNIVVDTPIDSNGRIFTFFLQSWSRLINPSLSPDFVIPLLSLLVFIVISIWFQCIIITKLKRGMK